MVASKILLLLSSVHATVGGEQVITQMKSMRNKFNYATVIVYVSFYFLYSTVAESSSYLAT